MEFNVKIYSSFLNAPQPDEIIITINSTYYTLLNKFLMKNNLYLIDISLIEIHQIDRLETDKKSYHLEDLINGPEFVYGHESPEYYFSLLKGISIKVNIISEPKKSFKRHLSISSKTNALQLFKMILKDYSMITSKAVYNLSHNTGKLKPTDLPAMAIQITGSNEFHIEIHQISQNEQLKMDYEKIISIENDYRVSRSVSNLSSAFHQNSERKHQRKLPQLSNSSFKYLSSTNVTNKEEEKNFFHENFTKEKKRSLPITPNESTIIRESCNQSRSCLGLNELEKKELIAPPEPLIKTNAIMDGKKSSSSSSSSLNSITETENSGCIVDRQLSSSVIPRKYSNGSDFISPSLYQIVKYCDLISIDLSIKSNIINPFPIELKRDIFQNLMSPTKSKPIGPIPVIGCDKSAFISLENGCEKNKYSVVTVKEVHKIDINFCNNNIYKGDILVYINDENILYEQMDYIYSKLTKNNKHEIIVARYKYLTVDSNSKKDEKISQLKVELDKLKKKYFALHSITIGNNQIIQQLNKELKEKQSFSVENSE